MPCDMSTFSFLKIFAVRIDARISDFSPSLSVFLDLSFKRSPLQSPPSFSTSILCNSISSLGCLWIDLLCHFQSFSLFYSFESSRVFASLSGGLYVLVRVFLDHIQCFPVNKKLPPLFARPWFAGSFNLLWNPFKHLLISPLSVSIMLKVYELSLMCSSSSFTIISLFHIL